MYRVLIVDDEPWAIKCIRRIFKWEEMGFCIIGETTNPYEALDIIGNQNPDVVLTDIRMPEISGIELVKAARSKGSEAEFIILSGFAEFEYAQEALQERVFDYRLKPIQREEAHELLAKLGSYLNEKIHKREMLPDKKTADNTGLAAVEMEESNEIEGDVMINFNRLLKYINGHYDEKLHLKGLANQFFINFTYCCELFKKVTGSNFSDYITSLRMKKACELLKSSELSITSVSVRVGYSDYYYFNRVFKKLYGVTPLKFRSMDKVV